LHVRFGYDHGGGYDREMGGRPGYGDERPHGRFMGRYQGETSLSKMFLQLRESVLPLFRMISVL